MTATARAQEPEIDLLCCSFCGKPSREVQKLIAGPGVCICDECVGLCQLILADKPLPSFPSFDDQDDDEALATMVRIANSREQVDRSVGEAVRRLRERGFTWARIGAALGITRQSAWERYSGEE